MKVLSGPEGDGLLTNVEVMEWLREKKASAPQEEDLGEGHLAPPLNAVEISNELLAYFEKCPSGTLGRTRFRETLCEGMELCLF